jgi:hypothetical protein
MQSEGIGFGKKSNYLPEKLHAILFEHHSVSAFAKLDKSLVRDVRQSLEISLRLILPN